MIYLASTSPRRRRLLRSAGMRFRVVRSRYQEKNRISDAPAKTARRHALGKALSAASAVKNGIILGADTLVWQKGRLIGKPKDLPEAFRILTRLQGKDHSVYTGVALVRMSAGKEVKRRVFCVKSVVRLKAMDRADMAAYFRRIRPLDKAGAYAAQAARSGIVRRVRGSFSNVVGLPLEALRRRLAHF